MKLTVITVTNTLDSIRGALSRWMIEVKPGVYIGSLSTKVRNKLWKIVKEDINSTQGSAIMVSSRNNEQGFAIDSVNHNDMVTMDGLMLHAKVTKA